jgi:formylglycine-generating enzyme
MKTFRLLLIILASGCAGAAVKPALPVGEDPPPGIDAALWKTVDALVAKLGNDNYHAREAAQKEIEALPAPALAAVKAFVERRSKDAEIKMRGGRAIKALEARALFEQLDKQSFTNSLGMKMRMIPAGEFLMGSQETEKDRSENEGPQHQVRITKPFYMGDTTVTKDQFAAFMRDSGYRTDAEKAGNSWLVVGTTYKVVDGMNWKSAGFEQAGNHPVVHVSWNDAKAFCSWLSKKEGKEYRLPTEAEWEYACRAGSTTQFSFGDDDDDLHKYGNYCDRSNTNGFTWQDKAHQDGYDRTAPVGSFKPNPWGLYDMHGNVWQWCEDLYEEDYYRKSPDADPTGPAQGNERVIRGGSWYRNPRFCRSTFRKQYLPVTRCDDFGFRVVVSGSKTPP